MKRRKSLPALLREPALGTTLTLALLVGACSSGWFQGTPDLPALPEINMENFLPAVRKAVRKGYEEARRRPEDAMANGRLGMILHAHDQVNAAAICYRRAHLLNPDSFRWVYYQGLVEAAQGKHQEAARTLEQALDLDPNYLPAQLKLAENLLAMARWDEGADYYQAVLKNHPNNAPAHYGTGRVLAARKEWKSAALSYQRACRLFPAFGASHYALATTYRRLGDNEKSEKHLRLYETNKTQLPPSGDSLFEAVRKLDAGALAHVRRSMELEKAGKLQQAAQENEKALEIDPQQAQALVNLIILYGRLGQMKNAEQHYRTLQELEPDNAEGHYNYGVILYELDRFREAEFAFRRTLETNPYHPMAHHNLGYLREMQGRSREALQHYRKAIENKPDNRLTQYHLGRLLVIQRKFNEGIGHLHKALEPEDEKTPTFLYTLAAAYARSGNRPKAVQYGRLAHQQAEKLGQKELAVKIKRDLEKLKASL